MQPDACSKENALGLLEDKIALISETTPEFGKTAGYSAALR
jgi:hypothetical protein